MGDFLDGNQCSWELLDALGQVASGSLKLGGEQARGGHWGQGVWPWWGPSELRPFSNSMHSECLLSAGRRLPETQEQADRGISHVCARFLSEESEVPLPRGGGKVREIIRSNLHGMLGTRDGEGGVDRWNCPQ